MKLLRVISLTLGPVVLTGLCYVVAAPARTNSPSPESVVCAEPVLVDAAALQLYCEQIAARLSTQIPTGWTVSIFSPFVMVGDLSQTEMHHLHEQTLLPTMRALQIDYFDREPAQPITIFLLSSHDNYRSALTMFGQSRREEYSGLYIRESQTILLNCATGTGTFAHELTHALAHADFPTMPEWFDEGLASLHEEAEFSTDGRHLIGRDNWRRRFLLEADQRICWKPLSRLLDHPFAEPEMAALDYALSRYFVMYLQDQGLLCAYYRKCRELSAVDSTGQAALLKLYPDRNLAELDADFHRWFVSRE